MPMPMLAVDNHARGKLAILAAIKLIALNRFAPLTITESRTWARQT